MAAAVVDAPHVISSVRGRVRLHLAGWEAAQQPALEARLCRIPGVVRATASPITGNLLITYDPTRTSVDQVLIAVRQIDLNQVPQASGPERTPVAEKQHIIASGRSRAKRVRIPIRGLDRDPDLAQRVETHLGKRHGVHARASTLTGRVLVEFDAHEANLDDILSDLTGMGLPDDPDADTPASPLDPRPLYESLTRSIGATLGLGVLAARAGFGMTGDPPGAATAVQISSAIGVAQGIPGFRYGLQRLVGRDVAALLVYVPTIITLTFSGSIAGLAVTGGEALRLLTEVVPRRAAWKRYEERLRDAPSVAPGTVVRLDGGERPARDARVIEGTGTALGRSGLPVRVAPGQTIAAGARLFGGPFVVELQSSERFEVQERPAPPRELLPHRYARALGGVSLGYAALTAVLTRSYTRTFAALLLVNPRTALIGADAAELGASARVLRAGMTIVGTRPHRSVQLPHSLVLDGPRVLVDGFQLNGAQALVPGMDSAEVLARAAALATANGAPWGGALRANPSSTPSAASTGGTSAVASEVSFDGQTARATLGGVRYWLRPVENRSPDMPTDTESEDAVADSGVPASFRLRHRGEHLLLLGSDRHDGPLGVMALRPRLAPGIPELVERCRSAGVELCLLPGDDEAAAQALARRTSIALLPHDDALGAIRERQATGDLVAFVSDNAHAGAAFAACDMGIGLTTGRGPFPARADFLAPDLLAVTAFVEAGVRRTAAGRDSVGLAVLSNIAGAVLGLGTTVALAQASTVLYGTAVAALADQWLRLRGGEHARSTLLRISDPRPERWGARSIESTLQTLDTSASGLSDAQARGRTAAAAAVYTRRPLWQTVLDQFKSPLTAILGIGAGVSLVLGAPADVAIIGATIGGNVLLGTWQERKADAVSESLNQIGTTTATVLRDGAPVEVPATQLVPGDVIVLAAGTRVAADARLIAAEHLEVDEAALTGESVPVKKAPDGPTDASRVVLDGSDVTTGTGRAVVFAVGRKTRMGATAAALMTEEGHGSPLDARLSASLKQIIPLALAGGALVTGTGFLRTRQLLPALATGATIAVAAVPEGLPILTRVSEAGVARRLASRHALMRRLSAVEALGRVDVACTDKTGTLTQGHLALTLVADAAQGQAHLPTQPSALGAQLRAVLLTAALASPSPDAPDAHAHPTDTAVLNGADGAGLTPDLHIDRLDESPFDPIRAFYATRIAGRVCVKGAPEALLPRCTRIQADGKHDRAHDGAQEPHQTRVLDAAGREALEERAQTLARQGLRVLMVAEGPEDVPLEDVRELTALGFIGISDPLRPDVPAAVRRCHEAGIRVIMITGDHPATAEAIAREAGLINGEGKIVTADTLAELQNGELDEALSDASVIARATPLDKLRIIESLQRHGHTVAMTGDGVNDAPALRLADVGIAMGQGGTEVARQTADVVLADDDFATLVEALVEGRSFWRNIRRAVGLLVGGNLGELGLVVGASVLGFASPLTARQILVVNMVTDILPGLAVALQQPESRNLADLSREGTAALDRPLRNDVLRRGTFTAAPALAAYLAAVGMGSLPQARTVAMASIVFTQLGQTLDLGLTEGHLNRPIVGAVGASAGLLVGAMAIPAVSGFLGLALPTPLGWALIGGATLSSVALSRLFNAATLSNGSAGATHLARQGGSQNPQPSPSGKLQLLGQAPAQVHLALPAPRPE